MEDIRYEAVITVIGKDMVGILAKVSTTCADANANVIEVTQLGSSGFLCYGHAD